MQNLLQDKIDMSLLTEINAVHPNQKFVLALSGGMDSATLYYHLLDTGHEVLPVIFNYGSKHNPFENEAAVSICHAAEVVYPVQYHRPLKLNLVEVFASLESALMENGEDIPEGHYEEESMRKTVVPGRNLIFAAVLASIAESRGFEFIALGVHSGDHHIYPDCRFDFIQHLMYTIRRSSDGAVEVKAPYLNKNKTSIIRGSSFFSARVPYELTRTCYKNQPVSCGKCGSCNERLEAFAANNMKDPIEYEEE